LLRIIKRITYNIWLLNFLQDFKFAFSLFLQFIFLQKKTKSRLTEHSFGQGSINHILESQNGSLFMAHPKDISFSKVTVSHNQKKLPIKKRGLSHKVCQRGGLPLGIQGAGCQMTHLIVQPQKKCIPLTRNALFYQYS